MRASSVGVLRRRAPAQRSPDGTDSGGDMASAAAVTPPGSMADEGSSGGQHPQAAWQAQAGPGQAEPGPSASAPESDDDKDGPEPVEYSPGGRYGRMDLVLGRGAFKTVRQTAAFTASGLCCRYLTAGICQDPAVDARTTCWPRPPEDADHGAAFLWLED